MLFRSLELANNLIREINRLWVKNSKKFILEIKKNLEERRERSGNCAYLLEPDLKEARGGLRDVNILRGLIAFNNQEEGIPIAMDRLAIASSTLANIRDEVQAASNPPRDLLTFGIQDQIATKLNFGSADELLLEVAKSARTVNYLISLQLHRLEHSNSKSFSFVPSRDRDTGEEIEPNIWLRDGEIHLIPNQDPFLALRAGAIAAQRGIPLNSESCQEVVNNFGRLPDLWPRNSREDLVALLGAGRAMVGVFEILDQEGLMELWIPEWKHLQFLPQRNALHRHTVDRHSLETAVFASELTRTVRRPDLLLIAALFHDLGKGFKDEDHSEKGAQLIVPLAKRLGFKPAEVETLRILVKEHLTLSSVATRRDLDDPATYRSLQDLIPDLETLNILHALSIADGQATGVAAWSSWKAKLVDTLVNGLSTHRDGVKISPNFELSASQQEIMARRELHVSISGYDDNFEIEVISKDRTGLLSTVAGVLSVLRGEIRSAKTKTIGEMAVMRWIVNFDPLAPIQIGRAHV